MNEKFQFVGKNLNEERIVQAKSKLESRREKGSEPYLNELEKTKEEVEFIQKAKDYVNEEMQKLGLSNGCDINPNDIHIFNTSMGSAVGTYLPYNQQIKVYRDNFPRFIKSLVRKLISLNLDRDISREELSYLEDEKNLHTLVHEMVHSASVQKHEVGLNQTLGVRKLGYETGKRKKFLGKNMIGPGFYFDGFNEGVVEKTTMDILKKHKIDPYESGVSYRSQVSVLNIIIRKISEDKKLSKKDVWKIFKKGQFTGEMMHLRDIEESFGPGSLRILALMPPKGEMSLWGRFFSTSSSKYLNKEEVDKHQTKIVNEMLNKKVLSKEDYKRYMQHRNTVKDAEDQPQK